MPHFFTPWKRQRTKGSMQNDILNVNFEEEKYMKLEYCDDIDLGLWGNCFDRNYKFYCLGSKYDGTVENYITCIILSFHSESLKLQ